MLPIRILMIVAFLCAVFVPAADTWFPWSPRGEWTENRKRATAPKLRLKRKHLEKLPRKLDRFYKDNFGFRDGLIKANGFVKLHWLQQSPVDVVLIGQNGWLFYMGKSNSDGASIQEFQGRMPLSPEQLASRRQVLEQRRAALAARGIDYYFVVAPNKQSVYPEHLPVHVGPRRPGNHLDAMVEYMRGSAVNFVDLRAGVVAGKEQGPLYFLTDTHWNAIGAFFGYRALMQHIPGAPIREWSDFNVQSAPRPGGDLAMMLGMPDQWTDVQWTFTAKDPKLPRSPKTILIIGDSYYPGIANYFDVTFAKVLGMDAKAGFDVEAIVAQKPDIVVDERVERYLMNW